MATPDELMEEPSYISDDGKELYEHFRFVADKGQIGRASCRERV